MKVKPIADRIVVKKIEAPTRTASGLYIPETNQEKPNQGVVLAIGEGIFNDEGKLVRPLLIKEGDKVLFGKYAGTNVVIDDEDLIVMQEVDVLCTLED